VKPADLLSLLEECYHDKLALRRRHVAAARLVGHYDFNNTYQYIIAREETQLTWLGDAIREAGGHLADAPEPDLPAGRTAADVAQSVIRDDAAHARAFVERWRDRVAAVSNARHRRMCEVIVAETQEHQRFFEQMLAGRADLLGRRPPGSGASGRVLPVRWIE
jgi:hypothetical protein